MYYIWIEGLEPRTGEKIKSLTDTDHTYTLKITEALRVKQCDVEHVKQLLREQGISNWCIDSPNTFVPTKYAPKGTLFRVI